MRYFFGTFPEFRLGTVRFGSSLGKQTTQREKIPFYVQFFHPKEKQPIKT